MTLTFGQYNTLVATRQCTTRSQLISQMDFDRMIINYYIAVLLKEGLIAARTDATAKEVCYQLTDNGLSCLEDYEQQNPALIIRQLVYQY